MPTLHQPVFAKPAQAGSRVRKEDGTLLPAEGDTVTHSVYWVRREADGDVVLSDNLPTEKTTKAKADKE